MHTKTFHVAIFYSIYVYLPVYVSTCLYVHTCLYTYISICMIREIYRPITEQKQRTLLSILSFKGLTKSCTAFYLFGQCEVSATTQARLFLCRTKVNIVRHRPQLPRFPIIFNLILSGFFRGQFAYKHWTPLCAHLR